MRAFNPKFEVITLFPNYYIYVILTLIDKQSSSEVSLSELYDIMGGLKLSSAGHDNMTLSLFM